MDFTTEGCTDIKNADLVDTWLNSPKHDRQKKIFEKICLVLNIKNPSEETSASILKVSRVFCLKMSGLWQESSRTRERFFKRNEVWLRNTVNLPKCVRFSEEPDVQPGPSQPRGRPPMPFEEVGVKTKKRRVLDLVHSRTSAELQFAAKLASCSKDQKVKEKVLSPQQALALCLDLDLSEKKYLVLRSVVNAIHKDCFPSVYALSNVKKALLPSEIYVDERSAEVNLQALLYHTAKSILELPGMQEGAQLKLICKWGFDGSSGHSTYKQKFSTEESTDEYLFLIALVPLKMVDINSNTCVWKNMKCSSTLFCRPIKFIFSKENPELVREEEQRMMAQINQLQKAKIMFQKQMFIVSFELLFTMMDGSISNVLSGTNSTSKCIICGATPKQMNEETIINRPTNADNFRFGLSTLHCWIRFFECILHIAYRLPIKAWQVKGAENKQIVDDNKKRIQLEFKSKMGLIVDKPKPGYGSTNDGNTARRFFSNAELSSEITGINKELIIKFGLILRTIASGNYIKLENFKILLQETRELYTKLYPWYYMPNTVHKVLIHGCEIIDSFDLPIGQLSEDALEARHKEVRKNRLSHTRKSSRVNCNKDLLNRLLLTSEPLISSNRKISTNKSERCSDDINQYLVTPDLDLREKTSDLNFDFSQLANFNESSSESD